MGQARKKDAKYNGVCRRPADEVLFHPERWFYTEIEAPKAAICHAETWALIEIVNNKGYDKGDIIKYFLPYRKQNLDDHKFICSGFSWAVIFKVAIWWYAFDPLSFAKSNLWKLIQHREVTDLPSPFRLALWCNKAGFKFNDLATGKEMKL
jgi:hypothetical protein